MRIRTALGCVALAGLAGCASAPTPEAVPAATLQLAPTGTLRAAMLNLPAYITASPGPAIRGPAADLAAALAREARVPLTIIRYPNIGAMLSDARTGKWDIAFMGHEPSRESDLDYAGVYLHSQNTFMVRADSPLRRVADLDREGVRIGTVSRSFQEATVKASFRSAWVQSFDNNASLVESLTAKRLEAIVAGRAYLVEAAAKNPGFRVLDENTRPSPLAVALPKGRPDALRFVAAFVRHARSSGLVARAVAESNAVGFSVPD